MANKYQTIIERLSNPGANHKEALTEAQLLQLEAYLGYPLPKDYREFLSEFAGVSVKALFSVKDEGRQHGEGCLSMFSNPMQYIDGNRGVFEPDLPLDAAPGLRRVLDIREGVEWWKIHHANYFPLV